MTKSQALHSFWSSFGWKAYDENTVPDYAELPYITYDVVLGDFGGESAMSASLWDRSTSWSSVATKEEYIAEQITRGGVFVPFDGGAMWIKKASPWAQRVDSDQQDIRRILLNISVEYID